MGNRVSYDILSNITFQGEILVLQEIKLIYLVFDLVLTIHSRAFNFRVSPHLPSLFCYFFPATPFLIAHNVT
jgi:hypothetical protein